jgi:hypothetical protein
LEKDLQTIEDCQTMEEINKINPLVALLVASLIAAKVVNNIGNKYTATKADIDRSLEYLLK